MLFHVLHLFFRFSRVRGGRCFLRFYPRAMREYFENFAFNEKLRGCSTNTFRYYIMDGFPILRNKFSFARKNKLI